MQLLKFELYKISRQTSIWVTFILLLGMSYLSLNYPYESKLEKEIYKQWEGPLTVEKLEQATTEYMELMKKEERVNNKQDVFTDFETMQIWMYQKLGLSKLVNENIDKKLGELETRNTVAAEMEANMIEDIRLDEFSHHTGPSQTVAFVEFGSFLVLGVMLILGLSQIYSKEYSSGMDNYLFSSKNGRKPLAWAKMGASLIYTLFVVIGWEFFNLLVNFILHGNEGWGTPIQFYTLYMNPAYAESPYALTMLEYHLIQLGIHLIAGMSFALFIVLISSLCKNALITFFVCAAVFIVPEFLGMVESIRNLLSFAYINVARVEFLFNDFKIVELFGYPILYPIVACLFMILLGAICVIGVLQMIKKREIAS
ncbi:hypothetical protein ACFSCX_17895 [Bacillus salitolerans]|uniref:ABC transporter permease n=1 Tax=Bacillus salitolerans TaxID=1437434 RepID=A0ABW4LW70_9BACI